MFETSKIFQVQSQMSQDLKSANSKSILTGKDKEPQREFLHRIIEKNITQNRLSMETALIYEDDGIALKTTNYSNFNKTANRIARALIESTQKTSETTNQNSNFTVAVCMKPSDNLVILLFAIWKAGASYLPIDVEFPENRVKHILSDAKPIVVIHDDTYSNTKFFNSEKSMKFSEIKVASLSLPSENVEDHEMLTKGHENTKALVIYTSGSSGNPKGIEISHFTFWHRISWQFDTFPFGKGEKHCVFKTSLIFIDHVAELWCPLMCGKAVVVVPKAVVANPELFVTLLEDYQINRLVCVPTLIRNILLYLKMTPTNRTKYMLSKLKYWFSSGETLTPQLANEFFEYFDGEKQVLINSYGSSEVCGDICWYEVNFKEQMRGLQKLPIGRPVPNTKIYILDKNHRVLPEGEVGEIWCSGAMIADGYLNRNENLGKYNFIDSDYPYARIFKTGDFGYIEKGLLYYEGRRDTQIKIRGHRIDIMEIENAVNNLKYVLKSVILVYHATQIDQAVIDFVVLKDLVVKTPFEIEKDLKSHLPSYMVPQIMILEELPYLSNGKIDRIRLMENYKEIFTETRRKSEMQIEFKGVDLERHPIAKEVFEIIGKCLGNELRDQVTPASNFFKLGGNSMNTVYTVMKLQEKGFNINLTDFINSPNLASILTKISTKKRRLTNMESIANIELVTAPINEEEKEACLNLIAMSFFKKSDMEKFLGGVTLEHYKEILEKFWPYLMEDGLSFMVKNDKGKLVGVCLNVDAADEPNFDDISKENVLMEVFEFLESIEEPILKHQLNPDRGEIVYALMYGTDLNISPKDKITVMGFMEEEIINLAKQKGYEGIFTINTNPLTQQIATNVFGYETLDTIQLNQYVDKFGKKPFQSALDHYVVIAMFKNFEE